MFGVLMLVLVGLVSTFASPLDIFSTDLFRRDTNREERMIPGFSFYQIMRCFNLPGPGHGPPRTAPRHEIVGYFLNYFCENPEERYECLRDGYAENRENIDARFQIRFNINVPYLFDTLAGVRHAIFFVCQRKKVIIRNAECLQGLRGPGLCHADSRTLFHQYHQPDSGVTVADVICNPINSTSKCFGHVASQCDPQLRELFADAGEMVFDGCTDDFSRV